jgi:hypothetical protein
VRIRYRKEIDTLKWDALVHQQSDSTVFTLSFYLDALSSDWCLLTDDTYSFGIALPFITRFGVQQIYTPVFLRYVEWVGDQSKLAEAIPIIQSAFPSGQLNVKSNGLELIQGKQLRFQVIKDGAFTINTQAKRMLSRFEQSGMKIQTVTDIKPIIERISEELVGKISGINDRSIYRLEKLLSVLDEKGMLEVHMVTFNQQEVGGVILIHFNGRTLYLKGAFTKDAKHNGAMYAVMHSAIVSTVNRNECFDFGGSNAEGVRRFNVNLGGKDEFYSSMEWDRLPRWFKLAQKTIRWIRK